MFYIKLVQKWVKNGEKVNLEIVCLKGERGQPLSEQNPSGKIWGRAKTGVSYATDVI